MSIVYTWTITQMRRQSLDDLVIEVEWQLLVTDENKIVKRQGSIELSRSDMFIPFEDLTEEIVLNWVKSKLDVFAIESKALDILENNRIPPKFLTGKPW